MAKLLGNRRCAIQRIATIIDLCPAKTVDIVVGCGFNGVQYQSFLKTMVRQRWIYKTKDKKYIATEKGQRIAKIIRSLIWHINVNVVE